jgi:glucose-6-phosphate 1-dehydrogenase
MGRGATSSSIWPSRTRFFGTVVDQLGKTKLADEGDRKDGKPSFWRRVVIEKPFGHSLQSARELNAQILRTLHEDQIFRIDHFLGKDTVQSIMAFRFANGLFEPIWNRDRIDHVQITAAETVGVEKRGNFYEATGALRDMVPNHVLSLLSMVAMEPPTSFDADAIRTKKADVFAAMPAVAGAGRARPIRRRYCAGQAGQGLSRRAERGARFECRDLRRDGARDRQLALGRCAVLRAHRQALVVSDDEIAIRFKQAPFAAFEDTPVDALRPNWLVLRIAPDEGISLQFEVKRRGR